MSDDFGIVREALPPSDGIRARRNLAAIAALARIKARLEQTERERELLADEKRDCAELVRQHSGKIAELQRQVLEVGSEVYVEKDRAEGLQRERDVYLHRSMDLARRLTKLEAALREIKPLVDPDREPFDPDPRKQVLAMRDVASKAWLIAAEAFNPDARRALDGETADGAVR